LNFEFTYPYDYSEVKYCCPDDQKLFESCNQLNYLIPSTFPQLLFCEHESDLQHISANVCIRNTWGEWFQNLFHHYQYQWSPINCLFFLSIRMQNSTSLRNGPGPRHHQWKEDLNRTMNCFWVSYLHWTVFLKIICLVSSTVECADICSSSSLNWLILLYEQNF